MSRKHSVVLLALSAVTLALLFAALPWSRPAQAEPLALKAPRAVVWEEFLGVNAHFLWFTPESYQRQMQRLRELGLKWVRVDLHWDRHEPQEGQYRFAELDGVVDAISANKLSSVFYLVGSAPFITSAPPGSPTPDQYPPRDPAVYADRLAMFATRYPAVNAWQVWNEPNLPAFWRPQEDPEGYGRLLLASARELREVAPSKPVVLGGMAYYSQMPIRGGLMLEALAQLGLQQLNTVIAYHPYSQKPEGDVVAERDFIVRAQQLNSRLRGLQPPAIWATEWGWSSYSGPEEMQEIIGRQGQADYVLRRVALMSALDYDKVFLFALSDLDQRATPRDREYGLLDLQGRPKPVFHALRRFFASTGPRLEPVDAPMADNPPASLIAIPWKRADGRRLLMFWAENGGTLRLPGIKVGQLIDPLSGSSTRVEQSGGLQLAVKPSLQMLVWE
jgi:beta-xylosidase